MPAIVSMPSLSPTMKKGNLVKWCVNEGDKISVGDVIAEVDTDKATMEVESLHNGVLAKILVQEKTNNVPVKTPIAIIRLKNDTNADIDNFNIPEVNVDTKSESIKPPAETKQTELKTAEKKGKISPLAKKIAEQYGIDISQISKTSGPGGRIVKADVLEHRNSSAQKRREGYTDRKVSTLQLAIADKMTECKQTVPHFYMQMTANVTDLVKILAAIKEAKLSPKITMSHAVIKATALAMIDNAGINVSWIGDTESIRHYETIDISVAVSAGDGIIYTPVIKEADHKDLKTIAAEVADFANRARGSGLRFEEFAGRTITISSLGMLDISCFYSIINSPQGSIMSVSKAMKAPVVDACGNITVGYSMSIGYAIDHRCIDGMTAGRFLESLKNKLENPILLFV